MNLLANSKKIKPKLIIIMSIVILCLVSGGVGFAKYTKAEHVKESLSLGNKYLQEQKCEEAIPAFEDALKLKPNSIEARIGLAKAYTKAGKADEAEKILKEAINTNTEKAETYLELAKLYISENNPFNAIDILNEGHKAANDEAIGLMIEEIISKMTVDNIDTTISVGENYSLPENVTVKINNAEVQYPANWEKTSIDTAKVGVYAINGTLENTSLKIKQTINVIGIASIENINKTLNQNDKYSLPSKIAAKMTDGSNREVDVTWNPSEVDTRKAGTYNYEGTVSRYDNKIKLTLNVVGIAAIGNINVSKNQNDKYSLPSKVTAKMTDGSTRQLDVVWNPSKADTSKAGSYTYLGVVNGYSEKVKLALNVKAKQNDDDYTPQMAIKLAKKYEGAADIDDIEGVVYGSTIKNGKKYYYVRLYSKSMRAEGGTGTVDLIAIAKDGSTISPY